MTELTETISSLCLLLLRQVPFILIAPTELGLTMEAKQFLASTNSVFLSMTDKLVLQPDGSFNAVRKGSQNYRFISKII